MKKTLKKIPLLLLILLQASFLLAIAMEQLTAIPILVFIIAILVFLLLAYTKVPTHDAKHLKRDFLAVLFVVTGALAAFHLNINMALGPVIAAAAVGTVASFAPTLNIKSAILQEVPAAAYCGAFVGMSSQQVAGNVLFILLASIVAGLLLVFSKNIFHGFGGKLGTVAFGGVAVTYLLIFLFLG
ncbi:hypothetical protein MKJ04_22035 [Pontibacter sp. E15-1]|uniref:hypothetical protein n=1 Tax=Pontibacter sp. E15-1 TaxID=2919918 RepID=UPI001F4F77EF|nr:hypothetical protein [Pontibacter sp. E15-1]MCJ8167538.1 hypothetical protein [Pontibacter sp. E15-1]